MENVNPSPETLNQPITSPVEGQSTENTIPEAIPYPRFQEKVQEVNDLKSNLQAYQNEVELYKSYLTQVLSQQPQQTNQETPKIDPNEYWNGADTNPLEWQNKRIVPLVDQMVKQEVQQMFQTYQAQQQVSQEINRAVSEVSQKYPYFTNPVAQEQLKAAALYFDRELPRNMSVQDVYMRAAEETLKVFGVNQPNASAMKAVADTSGNFVPQSGSIDDATLQRQQAVQKKDATTLAALALRNLNK